MADQLIQEQKTVETEELKNACVMDNEGENASNETISTEIGSQKLTGGLSKIGAYTDGIISSLKQAKPEDLLEEDFRTDLINICQKLKAVIDEDCLPLCRKIFGSIGIPEPSLESDDRSVKFVNNESSNPEFPPFNSRDIFAIRTRSINRDPLAEIGQMVDGPDTRVALSSLILPFVNPNMKECQVLIVEPTHELALQTYKLVQTWDKRDDSQAKITSLVCIGGTNAIEDKRGLAQGSHIVVGTPGRIVTNCFRNSLNINTLKACVLNHSDKLLCRGFEKRVHVILELLPPSVQFFSLTKMSAESLALRRKLFRRDPALVFIKDELTLDGIKQFYVDATRKGKFEMLCDVFKRTKKLPCLVFCNTKRLAKRVMTDSKLSAFDVALICNNMSQEERDKMVKDFLSGKLRILFTTDSRVCGLDLQDVPLIVNYDLPFKREEYINRVGLSIRGVRKRIAITLVVHGGEKIVKEMEKTFKTQIVKMPEDFDFSSSKELEKNELQPLENGNGKEVEKNELQLLDNGNENQCEKTDENHLEKVDESEAEKKYENHVKPVDEHYAEKIDQSKVV